MGCGHGIDIHQYDAIIARCVSWGVGTLVLLIIAIRSLLIVLIAWGKAHVLNLSEAFCFLLCCLLPTIHIGWPNFTEQDVAMDVILKTNFEVGNSALCIGLPFSCIGETFEGGDVGVYVTVLHF